MIMCDQVSDHIDQLEAEIARLKAELIGETNLLLQNSEAVNMAEELTAEIARLRLLCDNQRKALEDIFEARHKVGKWRILVGPLLDLIDAIETASTMTGTNESGEK